VFVGGFLAAGKTTAIASAAQHLSARGLRVGAITNDQASGLVDTATLRGSGVLVAEVAGGCFCCRFSELVEAADSVLAHAPDVLFCEAVGSCTDIVATVAEPFADFYGPAVEVAPVSVVVDPQQFAARRGDDVGYVYAQQLDEADLVVVNKIDLASRAQRDAVARACGDRERVEISAARGEGIESWLMLLGRGASCGHPLRTLDYDRYAHGEAMLAWLNATATIDVPHDPRAVAERLIARFATLDVAHVKLSVGDVRAHATGTCPAVVTGANSEGVSSRVTVNARVRGDANKLRDVVRDALHVVHARVDALQAFHPAYPHPENPNPYLGAKA
jgi:Ni2+-binding GTPase involved in maturation of urease and hydrogenase